MAQVRAGTAPWGFDSPAVHTKLSDPRSTVRLPSRRPGGGGPGGCYQHAAGAWTNASGKARAVSQDSHAPSPCPAWCSDRDAEGTPDHPDRHESQPYGVDAELPDTRPVDLHALAVQPVRATVGRIILGQGDDTYATLTSAASRSLAAALVRLADTLEGLVSL